MRLRYVFPAVLACLLPAAFAASNTPAKESDLAGEAVVVEQMSNVIRVAADGSDARTFEMKVRVLSDAGLRDAGTVTIPYSSSRESVTLDYVRVRKPDGRVVETPADDAQELPLPVTQAAPMYSDLRSKQLPVRSLSVGDTLEYKVSVKEQNADAPGAFWRAIDFTDGLPVRQETLELHIPRSMALTVKCKRVQPVVSEEGDERVYRWSYETVSQYPKKHEKEAAPVPLVQPLYEPDVAVTTYRSWAEFGAWYQGLMKQRAQPDAAIQAKADELTRGLGSDDEKIDALYHYVATQFRYISVSLGIGRMQPHTAADVFRNQYGDCKDKHTLLQAMLAAEKIEAEPVLIHSEVRLNEALPMPAQFDHMITRVKVGSREVWLDTTPEVAPSRVLLANLRGKQALAVPAHGDAQLVTTPSTLPFPGYYRLKVTAALDTQGTLTAHYDATSRGDIEVLLRSSFHQVPRGKWTELQQNISYQAGFTGEVSAVNATPPEKTEDPFQVNWEYTRKEFGDWPNRRIPGLWPRLGSDISADTKPPERAIQLVPDFPVESHAVLTLPEGYTLIPPDDVKRSTPFAEYTATYVLKGRTLETNTQLIYKVRELPPSEWAAYRAFEKAVSDDSGQMLQLFSEQSKPEAKLETTPVVKALSKDDQETAALIVQAEQAARANDLQSARNLLNQATNRNPHMRGLWMAKGDLALRSGRQEEGIRDYRAELAEYPDFFWAYRSLAWIYQGKGEWELADEVLREWGKAAPTDAEPRTALASSLLSQERYKDAVILFEEAIARTANPAALKLQLAEALLKSGETEEGKKSMHDLMDHSDDVATLNSAAYQLADADLDLRDDESAALKALAMLERRSCATDVATASKEDMTNVIQLAATWDTLGWIYYKEHKLPEAESYLRSAWVLHPDGEVGLHMGRVFEAEGKKRDALTPYRLGAKSLSSPHPPPHSVHLKQEMEARIEALKAEGVREKPVSGTQPGGDELGAMRTYTVPSPLKGEYASADFLLLLGDNRAEEVRFLKGAESLRPAETLLAKTEFHSPLPADSHAKILRRGILACTTGSKECLLVLVPPGEARVEE